MDTSSRSPPQTSHRQDTPARQTANTFALKIATIIAATVIIFYGDLALNLNEALQNPTRIYILIVPFTIAYLVYHKRNMLRAVMPLDGAHQPKNMRILAPLTGILLATAATLLYWQSSYAFTPLEPHIYTFTPITIHILALPILVTGLILILFNLPTLRQLAFPIIFLFFLYSPSSETLARALLVGFILLFILTIILIGKSDEAFRTRVLHKTRLKCNQCNTAPPPERDYCRACGRIIHPANARITKAATASIAAILIVACFLTIIQSPTFAINKKTPIIAINTPSGPGYSNQTLPETNQYTLTPSYLVADTTVEKNATKVNQNLLACSGQYAPRLGESLNPVQVGLEISSSQSYLQTLHSRNFPPPNSIHLKQYPVQIPHYYGSPISAQFFTYQSNKSGSLTAQLYWIYWSVFIINQTVTLKQTEIQLTVFNAPNNELPQIKQQLTDLATQIENYLLPGETWPQATARFLSHNGILLSGATSILLAATLFYYTAETRRRRKISLAAISKLNTLDAEIAKTLQRNRKSVTIENLVAELQEKKRQTITLEELDQKLRELENVGIIRSEVSSQNNIPVQTWKI